MTHRSFGTMSAFPEYGKADFAGVIQYSCANGTRVTTPTKTATVCPIYFRVAPADIAFVKFLFESYEEVGIVRTIDRHTAVIVLLVVSDFLATARAILANVVGRVQVTEIPAPAIDADDWLMREIERP